MLAMTMLYYSILLLFASGSNATNQIRNQYSTLASDFAAMSYHGGRLLTERTGINVYLIWYGATDSHQREAIIDYLGSFGQKDHSEPSVVTWWSTTASYKDKQNTPVSSTFKLAKEVKDADYSLGKNLHRSDIEKIVGSMIGGRILPKDDKGVYLVLTSKDATVERFCMNSCGFHDISYYANQTLVYAHVGDSSACPGLCAWPFAVPAFGPPFIPLVAPNSVGADGMIINIATVLAGAATNPYKDAYYQGDPLAHVEAVTACSGAFGSGSYTGYPGRLLQDKVTNASYNAYGANGKKFLLPAIWDLPSSSCKVLT